MCELVELKITPQSPIRLLDALSLAASHILGPGLGPVFPVPTSISKPFSVLLLSRATLGLCGS